MAKVGIVQSSDAKQEKYKMPGFKVLIFLFSCLLGCMIAIGVLWWRLNNAGI